MNNKKTLLILAISTLLYSEEQVKKEDLTFSGALSNETKIINSDKFYKSLGIGGNFFLSQDKFIEENYSLGVGLVITQPLSVSHGIGKEIDYSKVNNKGEAVGTFYFNELYFQYKKDDWKVKFLTQTIDTPLLGKGDNKFLPNSFDGITYKKSNLGLLRFIEAGFVKTMVGDVIRDDTSLDSKKDIGGSGLFYVGGESYDSSFQGYIYTAPEIDTGIADESYSGIYLEKKKIFDKNINLQMIHSSFNSNGSYTLMGVKSQFNSLSPRIKKSLISLSYVTGDDKGVSYIFGNVPEYTKMEEFNLESISAGNLGFKSEVGFNYSKEKTVEITAGLGYFLGKDEQGIYSTKEIKDGLVLDLKGLYAYDSAINIEGLFEYQSLSATKGNSVDNKMIVRLSANYFF
ncbi:MAG: hypothetical protein OIF32_05830 [Campylobacterales bacterium]|nr:hypothetical protein [Campylobacterales bacterium]